MSQPVVKKLSTIDRYLPVWIFAAMALGLGLGRAWPGIGPALDRVKLDTVSLPIAIGLIWMMYPVLAKVKYGKLGHLSTRRSLLGTSLVFNWIIGPILRHPHENPLDHVGSTSKNTRSLKPRQPTPHGDLTPARIPRRLPQLRRAG